MNRSSTVAVSTMRPRYMTATRSRDLPHHGQVVGDDELGQAAVRGSSSEQLDDLRLARHVERGPRFVEDQDLRAQRQGPGDADALALAAEVADRAATP